MSAPRPVRGEWSLPDFDRLLDVSAVLPELRRALQPRMLAGWRIMDARIGTVRNRTYSASKRSKSSALIRYDLMLRSVDGERRRRVELYVKAFLNGRGSGSSVAGGHLAVLLPELDAHAWIFPCDPGIEGLPIVADPELLVDRLPFAALDQSVDGPAQVDRIEIERLRYKPEDRCTLRVSMYSNDDAPIAAIAKVFSSAGRAEALFRTAELLHRRSEQSEGSFIVPRPLALDRDLATLWLSALSGCSPTRSTSDSRSVARIAKALASFHGSEPIVGSPVRTAEQQLSETTGRIRVLTEMFPALGGHLDDLATRLRAQLAGLEPARSRNVHGAFRLRQLLVADQGVGIIDFDSLAYGDPWEDVVDFALDLDHGPGNGTGCVEGSFARTHLSASFVDAYQDAIAEERPVERLRWHVPIQLLKRAYWLRHAARQQPSVAAELIRRVERACDPAERHVLEAVT